MFISCDNPSDSDDDNPSPALPENVGENPVKKTIKLKEDGRSDYYLELKDDGTALYIDEEDEYTIYEFAYTYSIDKSEIYMKVEKLQLWDDELLTYDEALSKIKEECTVEKLRQSLKALYEEEKDEYSFNKEYPGCVTYEKFEAQWIEGFNSIDDFVKYWKREYEIGLKAQFGAQITYSYRITDGKMTLTEKFTSVKNLLRSECEFYDSSNDREACIENPYASIEVRENDVYYVYNGYLDANKKTIDFEKFIDSDGKYETVGHVTATYTEDTINGTVTIKCEGKEYICEFEGQKFIQE